MVHCDLKPGNILVDQNCDLKICDLGLARAQELSTTDYVATKWYRAPEILLTWQAYDEKVDIWSAGCILAELLRGKPLFPGQNYIHQFHVITELLGTPAEDVISKMTTPNVCLGNILHSNSHSSPEYDRCRSSMEIF